MCYINSKETKGVFMKASKKTTDQVENIIKYDTTRKYFGVWTIRAFNKTYVSKDPVSFNIGMLSVDVICDALWKEMSYNPKRFGYVSPFKFNGQNSIYLFITKEIDQKNHAFTVLSKIQTYLSYFWNLALKYDETFAQKNHFKSAYIQIANIQNKRLGGKPIPGKNYKMLRYLRYCISEIALQNVNDFKQEPYRSEIIKTVRSKNPELFHNKNEDNSNLQKLLEEKSRLENDIRDKNSEIMDTESRINTLNNEFENPGDTSADMARLYTQNEDLRKLEKQLENVKNGIRSFGTNTYQK